MRILSLDISSSTIGWSTLEKHDERISLINYGHIKPLTKKKAGGSVSIRLKDALKKIDALFDVENPDTIIIEDYVKRFSSGRSSANTIILLAVFNETISLHGYDFTSKEPFRYTVKQLRSFIEKKFDVKIKDKNDVISFVENYFPNYKTTLNRIGNVKSECEDEADAILLGIYHLLL